MSTRQIRFFIRLLGAYIAIPQVFTVSAFAENKQVTFLQAPEGAKIVKFTLSIGDRSAFRQNYLTQRSPYALEPLSSVPELIARQYENKDFYAYEFARLPDGTHYITVLNQEKNLQSLGRNETQLWFARVYKVAPGSPAKVQLLKEGVQSSNGDVTFPIDLETPGIGANQMKSFHTDIGYSFNAFGTGQPQVYSGRSSAISVSGTQMVPEGKLTLTITVPEELKVTPDTQASIRFDPHSGSSRDVIATGKIIDYLSVTGGRFIITELAPDFSSASVAISPGTLEKVVSQQLALGSEMPKFSQVDLISRKAITREEILARIKDAPGVVFIFGDLPNPNSRSGPMMPASMPGNSVLPLPVNEIINQLGLEKPIAPLVVFVTRQISMEFLYQDLRNRSPEYLVLTDFTDPLRTNFRVPQNGFYGGSSSFGFSSREPSLRQMFNLPDRLSIVAFDRKGKVMFARPDAGSQFLPALSEASAALKTN